MLFHLACLRHLIGLIKAEWPIARQKKARQGWQAEKINRRRNLGLGGKRRREEGMREAPRARNQAAANQPDTRNGDRKTSGRKENKKLAPRLKADKEKQGNLN